MIRPNKAYGRLPITKPSNVITTSLLDERANTRMEIDTAYSIDGAQILKHIEDLNHSGSDVRVGDRKSAE